MKPVIERIDISQEELNQLLERARTVRVVSADSG
jgi:hypothetical protein